MRKLIVGDLQFSFTDQEVVSFVYPNSKKNKDNYDQLVINDEGNLELLEKNEYNYKKLRRVKASECVEIKKADFFMGKHPIELYSPLKLQGLTAVLVKFRDKN